MRDLRRGTLHLLLQALVGRRWLSTCFQGAIIEVYNTPSNYNRNKNTNCVRIIQQKKKLISQIVIYKTSNIFDPNTETI
jgi:hypothetical protein